MNIWDLDKLVLFLAFVIPGFVSIKFYEVLFPSESKDSSKQLIDAITYSSVNYAILFWLIMSVNESKLSATFPLLNGVFYFSVLFIFPIIWVLVWKIIRQSEFVQKNMPHPIAKPWDYVFSQRERYWVVVTLKDGVKIGGYYGENSFTSSNPASEQIYLEQCWVLNEDGGFGRVKNDTAGIIVVASDMLSVELFKVSEN